MEQQQKYDFAIIGGGVYGLSIAYHLAKSQRTVALFDRFTIGHSNGSSHGPSRITRSVYESELYRDLNTLALQVYWPQMEKVLNGKLIYRNEFIWYDQRKEEYEKFAKVAKSAKTNVKFMSPQQIKERFPSMPYIKSVNTPIVDFQAAMIAADDYVVRLGQYLKTLPNVAIFQNTEIKNIQKNKNVGINTQTETIIAEKVVVAAGRWVTQLLPELKDLFVIVKQQLTHFNLENPEHYQFGRIPSFVYASQNHLYYSTPDRKGLGWKMGSHSMVKDPREEAIVSNQLKQNQLKIAQELFKEKLKGVSGYAECYYTVTKTEQFVIDWVDPMQQKILVCSCCSGHGFKFAPLLGKVVTDLLLTNKSIQIFQKYRHTFQIPYHQGVNLN